VLYCDALARYGLVFGLLLGCQFCVFGFFVRNKQFFALVVLVETLIAQVQTDFQAFKPAVFRRELGFQDAVVMGLDHINCTQKMDTAVFGADNQ